MSATYRVKEYAAAVKLIMLTGRSIIFLILADIVINIISAIKLLDGGAAMLAADIINQSIDMVGMVMFRPLLIINLRELDILYVISAAANIAELRRP